MSVSRGCMLIEAKPGEWFCVVAQNEYDFDFTRGHNVYGPMATENDAYQAMSDNESNPGSSETIAHGAVTDTERKLIETGVQAR